MRPGVYCFTAEQFPFTVRNAGATNAGDEADVVVSVRFAERDGECTRTSPSAVVLVVTTYDLSDGALVDRPFSVMFED